MYAQDKPPIPACAAAPVHAPGANPLNIEPSVEALQALVQRLATTDLDAALQLSRLLTAAHQVGALAEQLISGGRSSVALAWLRRITREVDTLQAEWFRLHASGAPRLLRERRTDAPNAARTEVPLVESGNHGATQLGGIPSDRHTFQRPA
jgi:hypothetical protein